MSKNLYRSFLKNTEKSEKEKEIECIIITTIIRDLALKEKRRIEKGKKEKEQQKTPSRTRFTCEHGLFLSKDWCPDLIQD